MVKNIVKNVVFFVVVTSFSHFCFAAPSADLWPEWEAFDESSTVRVSHSTWAEFLSLYLSADSEGNRLVHYSNVSKMHHQSLKGYIQTLQAIDPRSLNRNEQFSYWVNLYNALTVDLILDNYPIKSITKLGGFFSFGPWDEKLVTVDELELSLNDIEHRILRPIWKDKRIHYAVNCASLGCPNLHPEPYYADRLDAQLDSAAAEFINSTKGIWVSGEAITLSEIYNWYAIDFGTPAELEAHLKKYLATERSKGFELSGDVKFRYDWSLNEVKRQ